MVRERIGSQEYWDEWVDFSFKDISKYLERIKVPSNNPTYRPQYIWELSRGGYLRLILRLYCRGDSIHELSQHFVGLLDAWELSDRLAQKLNYKMEPGQGWDHRHLLTAPVVSNDPNSHSDPRAWIFRLDDLNHYNWCFWLIGLALALDIPEEQWQRLLLLVGGEGEDELLDRVIASRAPSRRIGETLLHPKPYARLLKAVNAPNEQQAVLLRDFVDHWYPELKRKGKDELWWYIYGDPEKHPLEKGSYFGRWCVEAVAAVKAFGMDDSLCLGHEYYPGDLLRPDGPTTHPLRVEPKKGLLARLFRK